MNRKKQICPHGYRGEAAVPAPGRKLCLAAAIAAIFVVVGASGAVAADTPVLWPEEQRAFWMDGPGLLLDEQARAALATMSEAERTAWINEFLADPDGSTSTNELTEAIQHRQTLMRSALSGQFTLLDERAQVLFLHGLPYVRQIVDCEHVYRRLEIWGYAKPGAQDPSERKQQDRLVLYQPSAGQPFRLWRPGDGKRPLYTDEMEYWLDQYHELQAYISGRRFDLQLCKEAREIDRITGIGGLVDFKAKRPRDEDMLAWLAPPRDLRDWARVASQPSTDSLPALLEPKLLSVRFPKETGQRIVSALTIALDRDERLEPIEENEGEPEYRLQIIALAERYAEAQPGESIAGLRGEIFDETLVRYRIPIVDHIGVDPGTETTDTTATPESTDAPPQTGENQIGLVFERGFRPGEVFQLRLLIRDEVSGASGSLVVGLDVPDRPIRDPEPAIADLVLARGDQMVAESIPGADGIVLVPPETDVVLGLWRAEALVSGSNIQAVRFLVDGQQQFKRRGQPYSAELRLAKYPREQIVRVEGLDAEDTLVAADEIVLNQQRGELRVRIVEPARGASAQGQVTVRAEVVVPEERRVRKVEFSVNNELQATVESAPWTASVDIPAALSSNDLTFLTVVAELDDGARAEDVRFLNMPDEVEELNVDYVELYTSVSDRSNRPVQGLDREAFQVFEDGRPQEIAKFELVEDLPITVGITIDTSGSMTRSLGEARRAAIEFLKSVVTARDRSFAVGFADRPRVLMPRTSDVVAVSRALAAVRANGNTSLYDAVVTSLYYFRGVRGRRALILLSDGEDTASSIPYRDAREYAQRSGVAIYTIGLNIGRLQVDVRNKLNELAGDTGGRSFFISKAEELRTVYGEIERELRSQYLLAYASDRPQAGGEEFREVDVKMVGAGRGLKARTISGYYP